MWHPAPTASTRSKGTSKSLSKSSKSGKSSTKHAKSGPRSSPVPALNKASHTVSPAGGGAGGAGALTSTQRKASSPLPAKSPVMDHASADAAAGARALSSPVAGEAATATGRGDAAGSGAGGSTVGGSPGRLTGDASTSRGAFSGHNKPPLRTVTTSAAVGTSDNGGGNSAGVSATTATATSHALNVSILQLSQRLPSYDGAASFSPVVVVPAGGSFTATPVQLSAGGGVLATTPSVSAAGGTGVSNTSGSRPESAARNEWVLPQAFPSSPTHGLHGGDVASSGGVGAMKYGHHTHSSSAGSLLPSPDHERHGWRASFPHHPIRQHQYQHHPHPHPHPHQHPNAPVVDTNGRSSVDMPAPQRSHSPRHERNASAGRVGGAAAARPPSREGRMPGMRTIATPHAAAAVGSAAMAAPRGGVAAGGTAGGGARGTPTPEASVVVPTTLSRAVGNDDDVDDHMESHLHAGRHARTRSMDETFSSGSHGGYGSHNHRHSPHHSPPHHHNIAHTRYPSHGQLPLRSGSSLGGGSYAAATDAVGGGDTHDEQPATEADLAAAAATVTAASNDVVLAAVQGVAATLGLDHASALAALRHAIGVAPLGVPSAGGGGGGGGGGVGAAAVAAPQLPPGSTANSNGNTASSGGNGGSSSAGRLGPGPGNNMVVQGPGGARRVSSRTPPPAHTTAGSRFTYGSFDHSNSPRPAAAVAGGVGVGPLVGVHSGGAGAAAVFVSGPSMADAARDAALLTGGAAVHGVGSGHTGAGMGVRLGRSSASPSGLRFSPQQQQQQQPQQQQASPGVGASASAGGGGSNAGHRRSHSGGHSPVPQGRYPGTTSSPVVFSNPSDEYVAHRQSVTPSKETTPGGHRSSTARSPHGQGRHSHRDHRDKDRSHHRSSSDRRHHSTASSSGGGGSGTKRTSSRRGSSSRRPAQPLDVAARDRGSTSSHRHTHTADLLRSGVLGNASPRASSVNGGAEARVLSEVTSLEDHIVDDEVVSITGLLDGDQRSQHQPHQATGHQRYHHQQQPHPHPSGHPSHAGSIPDNNSAGTGGSVSAHVMPRPRSSGSGSGSAGYSANAQQHTQGGPGHMRSGSGGAGGGGRYTGTQSAQGGAAAPTGGMFARTTPEVFPDMPPLPKDVLDSLQAGMSAHNSKSSSRRGKRSRRSKRSHKPRDRDRDHDSGAGSSSPKLQCVPRLLPLRVWCVV